MSHNVFAVYCRLATAASLGLCLHGAHSLSTSTVTTETEGLERVTANLNLTTQWATDGSSSPPTTEPPTTAATDPGLDSYAIAAIVVCSILGVLIICLVVGKVIHSRTRGQRATNVSSENLKEAENGSDRSTELSRNAPVHFTNAAAAADGDQHPVANGYVRSHPSLGEGPPAGSTHKRDIPTDLKEFLHAFLEDNTAKVVHAKLRLAEEDDIETEAPELIPHASVLLDAELQDQVKAFFSADAWRLVKALLKNLEAMINDNTLKHSKAIDTQIGTFGKGKGKGKSSRSVSRSNSLQSLERNNNDISQPIIVQHM